MGDLNEDFRGLDCASNRVRDDVSALGAFEDIEFDRFGHWHGFTMKILDSAVDG